MRFAVPVSGGMLSPHFGHCEQFALFDVNDDTKTIVKKEFIAAPPHQPGLLPVWLAEKNVTAILAGGMGAHAQALFQQNNIKVVIGVTESDPETAVSKYLNESLITGNNICDH